MVPADYAGLRPRPIHQAPQARGLSHILYPHGDVAKGKKQGVSAGFTLRLNTRETCCT